MASNPTPVDVNGNATSQATTSDPAPTSAAAPTSDPAAATPDPAAAQGLSTVVPASDDHAHTVHDDEDIPPLAFSRHRGSKSGTVASGKAEKYKVDVQEVSLDGDLQKTVQELINTINAAEKDTSTPHLVYYHDNAIRINGIDEPVNVPQNIDNNHLAKHYLDMDMLGNYVNLYIDHIYFFRSHETVNEIAKDEVSQQAVRDIIAKLSSTFRELEQEHPPLDGVQDLKEMLAKIVVRIEKYYLPQCTKLFDDCANTLNGLFDQLGIITRPRSKTFLAVFIHYILSRMLVLKLDQSDPDPHTKDKLRREIDSKKAVLAGPAPSDGTRAAEDAAANEGTIAAAHLSANAGS